MTDAGATVGQVVQRLADIEAIRALKMRYTRVCDDGYDPEGIASLFTEDGVWDGGELFGRCEGRAGIVSHFTGASAFIPWALHYALCPEIDVAADGATAEGTWYLWQPCQVVRHGEASQRYLAGTYHDRYVKVDGAWRFRSVEVEARWLDTPPPGTGPAGTAGTPPR